MSRICHVLIAHIMYLFYFYSSSYNLFINWGQTGDKTCDKACDKLVTSSSFLQGIAKTSLDSALNPLRFPRFPGDRNVRQLTYFS